MSLNVAVPLSAATTRYGSSPSWRTVSGGGTMAPADDVVGEVEQTADELAVAGHTFGTELVGAGRGPLQDEAALGAGRHDHRVLDDLRLDEPEDLGAEVFASIAPPDAAAGDPAVAEVNSFDAWRAHPDLEHRVAAMEGRAPSTVSNL